MGEHMLDSHRVLSAQKKGLGLTNIEAPDRGGLPAPRTPPRTPGLNATELLVVRQTLPRIQERGPGGGEMGDPLWLTIWSHFGSILLSRFGSILA